MLLVAARRGPSRIHGFGLIVQAFISRGTPTWRFQEGFDVILSEDDFRALSLEAQKQVLNYAKFDVQDRVFVLGSDDDRFTNHSDDPTIRWEGDDLVAVRDLHPGDEITCDYRDFGWTHFFGGPDGLEPTCLPPELASSKAR